jgi:hypothetical protein
MMSPAKLVPVEIYTPERRAEFLLNSAVEGADYHRACGGQTQGPRSRSNQALPTTLSGSVRCYSMTFFSIGSTVTPVLRSHVSARSI